MLGQQKSLKTDAARTRVTSCTCLSEQKRFHPESHLEATRDIQLLGPSEARILAPGSFVDGTIRHGCCEKSGRQKLRQTRQ